ncbi:DUF4251 domain-containing protein [Mariniflexile gromovii]|uniref:DUF4251 domain-containing protein n=1 Tax=Mariniflexile gromovii TaxID=362523 RepID=A0ABS4BP47_9FLAO|nr:DUF4251 domain-containing protein [Mariniflexile gromovii]MBP0902360.1 DUF4251 domain-containing protein [Mariniflexile gromovii]
MKPFYFFISLCFLIIVSCKSQKVVVSPAELDAFNDLVKSQHFQIESDWLYPQGSIALQQVLNSGILPGGNNANSINLIGNPNFLNISGDSISSYLPYYGERQMNIDYGGRDSAIEFDGTMKNYEVEHNQDNSYTITFDAKSRSENFKVFIKLSPNLKTDMTVNGNSRSSIRYTGKVHPLNEEL